MFPGGFPSRGRGILADFAPSMHSLNRIPAVTDSPAPAAPVSAAEPLRPPQPVAAERAVEREIGGPAGPEPTRYGDWERKGRCIDF